MKPPKNPWLARIWTDMLRTGTAMTEAEIIRLYGSQPGGEAASILWNAVENGWMKYEGARDQKKFRAIDREAREKDKSFRALEGLGQVRDVFEFARLQ